MVIRTLGAFGTGTGMSPRHSGHVTFPGFTVRCRRFALGLAPQRIAPARVLSSPRHVVILCMYIMGDILTQSVCFGKWVPLWMCGRRSFDVSPHNSFIYSSLAKLRDVVSVVEVTICLGHLIKCADVIFGNRGGGVHVDVWTYY
jgi:hypothetical protein